MLKIAIVGCGKIADAHASQISRIDNCEIVAVCDREPLMARQLSDRFRVQNHFSDLTELLHESQPDVVHITTPPDSHFDIARLCLESGCHVYVEKPFTLDAVQACRLLALANERKRKITVGHDDQFSPVARRMRSLVQSGFLGDCPIHMESHYCYDVPQSGYAAALFTDKKHWVRRLPGQLLQNVISHGIARIAEFLVGDSPQVVAMGFVSPALRSLGEDAIIDELRVIISDERGTTAYFTFSSRMRPSVHQFCIYGTENGIALDQDHETLVRLQGQKLKSYLDKFIPPLTLAQQYVSNAATNIRSFLARDFHMKSGMKYLVESFYRSIAEDCAVPIPYREILLTTTIMDEIFRQLKSREVQADCNIGHNNMSVIEHTRSSAAV